MAGPTDEAPAAAVASLKSGVSEEMASTAEAARPREFWPFGEDKSVHRALGGGKSMNFSVILPHSLFTYQCRSELPLLGCLGCLLRHA
jgi:hypothetical protein